MAIPEGHLGVHMIGTSMRTGSDQAGVAAETETSRPCIVLAAVGERRAGRLLHVFECRVAQQVGQDELSFVDREDR